MKREENHAHHYSAVFLIFTFTVKQIKLITIQYMIMQGIARYTTLFAPVIFFLGGVAIIILLSKFIGMDLLYFRGQYEKSYLQTKGDMNHDRNRQQESQEVQQRVQG